MEIFGHKAYGVELPITAVTVQMGNLLQYLSRWVTCWVSSILPCCVSAVIGIFTQIDRSKYKKKSRWATCWVSATLSSPWTGTRTGEHTNIEKHNPTILERFLYFWRHRFWSQVLVQRNTAEAIFRPNLLQTLAAGRRWRRRREVVAILSAGKLGSNHRPSALKCRHVILLWSSVQSSKKGFRQ